jgi:cell division septation protein DedD
VTTVTVATSEAPPVKEASPINEAPPVKEAPKAAPAPAVKNAPAAKPLALVPVPSSPAYWVQLGSYREDKNVNEAFRILQSKGYKARIVDDIKHNWRNVQAGPYATQAQADKAARDLRLTPGWFSDCYVYRG